MFAVFDNKNRFYYRKEDSQNMPHFSTPVNVLDYYIPAHPAMPETEVERLTNILCALGPMPFQLLEFLWQLALKLRKLPCKGCVFVFG